MLEKTVQHVQHIFYLPTKFGEDNMIDDGDMPPKLNSKLASGGGILLPVAISTRVLLPSYV